MVLADRPKQFLLHLESYLVYEKEHKVGHCHQILLAAGSFFCCQYTEASLIIM